MCKTKLMFSYGPKSVSYSCDTEFNPADDIDKYNIKQDEALSEQETIDVVNKIFNSEKEDDWKVIDSREGLSILLSKQGVSEHDNKKVKIKILQEKYPEFLRLISIYAGKMGDPIVSDLDVDSTYFRYIDRNHKMSDASIIKKQEKSLNSNSILFTAALTIKKTNDVTEAVKNARDSYNTSQIHMLKKSAK